MPDDAARMKAGTVACRRCKGTGSVPDHRSAGTMYPAGGRLRMCRECSGTGRRPVVTT